MHQFDKLILVEIGYILKYIHVQRNECATNLGDFYRKHYT